MSVQLRVLLVEPYYSGSHRAWADGYAAASSHDVRVITHDARFWKWRMAGAAVTLAEGARAALSDGPPDVVLASDMLHLPAFLGMARSVVGTAPAVLYMHENQLTYPRSKFDTPDLVYPMMNWSSMAAADAIWFNSRFHLDAWFEALPEMLGSLPDYRHVDLVEAVVARASVVPVGVDLRRFDPPARRADDEPPLVLWNHRWEYDKDPEAFFASLRALVAGAVPFRVALAGENFRNDPEEFRVAADELGDRVVQYGFADEAAYRELIRNADVVVSTARQEFFGISVVEAMYAGAVPVLPDRLSYPELVPEPVRERCLYRDAAGRDALLQALLGDPGARAAVRSVLRPEMARFDWSQLAPRYDALLGEIAGRGISRS